MEDAVISFAIRTIGSLLIDEGKFLHGVKDQAEELHSDLKRLQWFLKDADTKAIEKERVQPWILEARDIAYDAEDLLEGYAFKVASWKDGGLVNVLQRCVCILNDRYLRHSFGSGMQALKNKILNLQTSFQAYGVRTIMEKEGSSSHHQLLRQTYSFVQEDDFVGLEDDVELLVKHLVGTDDQNGDYRVVSICGMGGLGKTTLANKVYNHPVVKRRFTKFAWVCVSQQWQGKDILLRIMNKFASEKKNDDILQRIMNKFSWEKKNDEQIEKNWTEEELIKQLLIIQQQMKCLIVLDDIWTKDAWESIKHAFPTKQKGSKILVTTRNRDVALHISPGGFHHQPRLLNEDESWELLRRKTLRDISDEGHFINNDMNKLVDLGKKMATSCGGLPLALVVLGGIISTKNTLSEWENVYKNIKSYLWKGKGIGEGKGEVPKILAMSYNDLPFQLKPCFLYLGSFPEDAKIDTDTLYQMWIAEGMILMEDRFGEESMMELAERYLGELWQRGMVQLRKTDLPGSKGFESCQLHDLMRDLCLFQAQEESFLKFIRYSSEGNVVKPFDSSYVSPMHKLRRLVISLDPEDAKWYAPPKREVGKYLRMLQFVGRKDYKKGPMTRAIKSQLNSFHMLRVLSMEGLRHSSSTLLACYYGWKLPESIGKLVHLRYLSLYGSFFVILPSSIGNLKNLLTLDLRLVTPVFSLPNVLWKLKRLTCLYLPSRALQIIRSPSRIRLCGLNKLEILENFRDDCYRTKDLLKLTNLRVLTIKQCVKFKNLEMIANYVESSPTLQRVTILSFCMLHSNRGKERKVLEQLLYGKNIHILRIGVATWKEFPETESNMSSSIVQLGISCKGLDVEDAICKIVKKFSHLRILVLFDLLEKEVNFHPGDFLHLEQLGLHGCQNLESCVVEIGAMPKLSSLWFSRCPVLEAIPDGLQFITTLEELEFFRMPQKLRDRIRTPDGQEGEDFHKISQVPLVLWDRTPL